MVKQTPMQGDIIKINLNPKKGHEQQGYRPYLCLSNQLISQTSNIAVFAPISNTAREYPFYYPLNGVQGITTTGKVLLDQLVAVDYNARQYQYIESIDRTTMNVLLSLAKLIFDENK